MVSVLVMLLKVKGFTGAETVVAAGATMGTATGTVSTLLIQS